MCYWQLLVRIGSETMKCGFIEVFGKLRKVVAQSNETASQFRMKAQKSPPFF